MPTKEKELKHDGYRYVLNPYRLVWNGEYYYVFGWCEKHNAYSSYRVDRMAGTPEILDDEALPLPENFDIEHYLNTMIRMYNSERKIVRLVCENWYMDALVDRFGENIETEIIDDNTFAAIVETPTNTVFYSWIFGFGGKVRIVSPNEVVDEYRQVVMKAFDAINK